MYIDKQDNHQLSKDRLQSEVFNYLRFPLIVGVVFIHNFSSTVSVGQLDIGDILNIPIYNCVSTLFSKVIALIAVPLFFLMSGYLFFYKVENFNSSIYLEKLRKRFKSLVIPFLFWNALFLLIFYFLSQIPFAQRFFQGHEYTLEYIITSFWGRLNAEGTMTYPLAYQFWFIRDLIVCVCVSPILYFFVTHVKYVGIILLGIGWFIGLSIPYIGIRGFSTTAIFFFTLGAYCSINKINLITISRQLRFFGYAYIIFAILDLVTKICHFNPLYQKIGILSGIVFVFLLTAHLLENNKIRPVPLLTSASFFIFAIHDPWLLTQIRKLLYLIFRPESDLAFTLLYFLIVLLVIMIALAIYKLLRKITPSFTQLITGGR